MRRLLASLTLAVLLVGAGHAQSLREVYLNRVPLGDEEVWGLERITGATIPDGWYWYDRVSGLVGREGGPALGQIAPGLTLGGPLAADASGGGTGLFLNGREIHPLELEYLRQLFGAVPAGRYWLNAWGVGGLEGGPPLFDLRAASPPANGGGGNGDYTYRGPGGQMGGDGNCFYYNDPATGSSYMPPGC